FPFSAPLPVHHREREDVRFSVEIRAALLMIISPFSGDPSGRLGLLEVGLQRGEKAGQSTIPVNAPELLLGNHKPGTHPAFDLIARPPSLHIAANDTDNRERRLNDVGAT